jgi:hypothetical protein
MELNGVHNLVVRVRKLQESNLIPTAAAKGLLDELELLDRYLTAYQYLPGVKWHEVKAAPQDYPKQREVIEKTVAVMRGEANNDKLVEEVLRSLYSNYVVVRL